MRLFEIKLAKAGGGSGVFRVEIYAATPDEARRLAQNQYPGYRAVAVRASFMSG